MGQGQRVVEARDGGWAGAAGPSQVGHGEGTRHPFPPLHPNNQIRLFETARPATRVQRLAHLQQPVVQRQGAPPGGLVAPQGRHQLVQLAVVRGIQGDAAGRRQLNGRRGVQQAVHSGRQGAAALGEGMHHLRQ